MTERSNSSRRWYFLRHPSGFSPQMEQSATACAEVWVTWVEAIRARGAHLVPDLGGDGGESYQLSGVSLSSDRRTVSIEVVGGAGTYGWLKLFEDVFPSHLYEWLPLWFQVDLELGRRGPAGMVGDTVWTGRYGPSEKRRLREMFPPPEGYESE